MVINLSHAFEIGRVIVLVRGVRAGLSHARGARVGVSHSRSSILITDHVS